MTWYNILLIVAVLILIAQFLATFFFGDLDIDSDFDGDLTGSDFLSFKGITHFVLGFSLVLTLFKSTDVGTLTIAVTVGLGFCLGLGWIYKLIYKNLSCEIKYTDVITKASGTVVWFNKQTGKGEVNVNLKEGLTLIPFESEKYLKTGDSVKVTGDRNLVHIL